MHFHAFSFLFYMNEDNLNIKILQHFLMLFLTLTVLTILFSRFRSYFNLYACKTFRAIDLSFNPKFLSNLFGVMENLFFFSIIVINKMLNF